MNGQEGSDGSAAPSGMTFGPDPSAIPPECVSSSVPAFGLDRSASALGMPAETIDGVRQWLTAEQPSGSADVHEAHRTEGTAELRALWGDDMQGNLQLIDRYLHTLPADAGIVFRYASGEGGRALANDPAMLQRLLGAAKARADLVLPAGNLDGQIKAMESYMRAHRAQWNRDELLQARYRELLTLKHG